MRLKQNSFNSPTQDPRQLQFEIENNKTKRKRVEFSFPETKKLKITQYPKLSENYSENSKGKLSEELEFYPIYTLSSNDLQALSWAFALGGIGLKEALVDCS